MEQLKCTSTINEEQIKKEILYYVERVIEENKALDFEARRLCQIVKLLEAWIKRKCRE